MNNTLSYHLARQIAVIALLAGGCLITIATSPPPEPFPGDPLITLGPPQGSTGSLFISWPLSEEDAWSNLTEDELEEVVLQRRQNPSDRREVLISQLSPNFSISCDEVTSAPLDYLTMDMFTEPTVYSLAQGDVIQVQYETREACAFLNIVGSGLNSAIVTLPLNMQRLQTSPANGLTERELMPNTLIVDDLGIRASANSNFIQEITPWSRRGESEWRSCESDYATRLSWSFPSSAIDGAQLSEIRRGVDGCHDLRFKNEQSMLLCAPWEALEKLDRTWWVIAYDEKLSNEQEKLYISLYESPEAYAERTASFSMIGSRGAQQVISPTLSLSPLRGCEPIKSDCYISHRLQADDQRLDGSDYDDGRPPIRLDSYSDQERWLLAAEHRVLVDTTCAETIPTYYSEEFIITDLRGEE